jgi:hypothetical protein
LPSGDGLNKQIAAALFFIIGLTINSLGQKLKAQTLLGANARNALEYFDRVKEQRVRDFLKSIRPEKISIISKARILPLLRKEDIISPSAEAQARLIALTPILEYHERNSVIELKILQAPQATTVFLAGGAVLITEPALRILTQGELQAAVAHELAHEYFWNEYELARQHRQSQRMQELELRCDGIAVMTLIELGFNPECLITGITTLMRYNEQKGFDTSSDAYSSLDERIHFVRAVICLIETGDSRTHQMSSYRLLPPR